MKMPAVGFQVVGYFDSRDEMERKAPRECDSIVQTPIQQLAEKYYPISNE